MFDLYSFAYGLMAGFIGGVFTLALLAMSSQTDDCFERAQQWQEEEEERRRRAALAERWQ